MTDGLPTALARERMPLHSCVLSCDFLSLSWQNLHTVCLALNPELIKEIQFAVIVKRNICLWMRVVGMGWREL